MGTRGSFPRGKVAGVWSWPLTSSSAEVKNAWSYTSAPTTRLHGVVLNWSAGTIFNTKSDIQWASLQEMFPYPDGAKVLSVSLLFRCCTEIKVDVLGEWRYSSMHSLTSALDGSECSASRPSHFTPRERVPVTQRIGGWVGPRASLDAVSKGKIPSPRRESNSDHPIFQPVASRYTDWAIPALLHGITPYNLTELRNPFPMCKLIPK
jgi:hypothetical protein